MIKRISVYSLPEGTDPEAFWKYQKGVHASEFIKLAGPGLKKYTVNRISKVTTGEANFYGYSETWWENEAAMEEFANNVKAARAAGKNPSLDDFKSRVTGFSQAIVEEEVMVNRV